MEMRERRKIVKALSALPSDWTITLTVGEILKLIGGPDEARAVRWIKTTHAAAITGVPQSTLRHRAPKWLLMQERGQRPPIHVTRMGPNDGSHWLFDQADCYEYARANGSGTTVVTTAQGDKPAPSTGSRTPPLAQEFGGVIQEVIERHVREPASHLLHRVRQSAGHTMRFGTAVLALAVVVGACSDSSGPDRIDPQELVGTWTITLEEQYSCISTMVFTVPADAAESVNGGTMNVFSEWGIDPAGINKTLTGHFNLDAETFRLVLWWNEYRAEYSGTIQSGPTLRGSFTAPRGMLSAFETCRGEAAATK